MKAMRMMKPMIVPALVLALASCTFGLKARPDLIAEIKRVRVDVRLPAQMTIGGREAAIESGGKPNDRIAAIMQSHRIDAAAIVQAEFAKALSEAGHIVATTGDAVDATIEITVESYGLQPADRDSHPLYPAMQATAKMTRIDGAALWRESEYVMPLTTGNSGGHRYSEYVQQPERLRETWSNASGILGRALVATLYLPVEE
jgi:hypothetical protein